MVLSPLGIRDFAGGLYLKGVMTRHNLRFFVKVPVVVLTVSFYASIHTRYVRTFLYSTVKIFGKSLFQRGIIKSKRREEEREITGKLLNSLMVIDVDRKIAVLAEDYLRTIKSHHLELDDCLIAATCVTNNATLITCNIKHYPVKGLEKREFRTTS